MTLHEIKEAVDAGKVVHWKTNLYTVVKDRNNQYLIKSGEHCIGLTWADGITMNGKEEDFYIEADNTPIILGPAWHNCKDTVPIKERGKHIDYSYTVLIDLTGERKYYATGWFDLSDHQWMIEGNDLQIDSFDVAQAKWSWLPLAELDGVKLENVKI